MDDKRPLNAAFRRDLLLLAAACLTGAIFRAYDIGGPSLWLDELNTFWMAGGDGWSSVWPRAECLHYSPFYGYIQRIALMLLGHTEFALRALSLAAGILTIPAVYVLGIALADRSTGVIAALIVAVNVDQIFYAQQARPYAICVLFAVVSMLALVRYIATGRRIWQGVYIGSTAIVIDLHWVFLPLTAVQAVYWVYRIVTERSRVQDWIVTQGVVGLLFLPLLPFLLESSGDSAFGRLWAPPPNTGQLLVFFDPLMVPLVLTVLGALLGMALRRRSFTFVWSGEEAHGLVLILLWYLMPVGLLFFLDRALDMPVFLKRYLMVYSIPVYLLIAYGLSRISPAMWRYSAALGFVGLITLYAPVNAYRNNGSFAFRDREDWRSAIQYLQEQRGKDEPALLEAGIAVSPQYLLNPMPGCSDLPYASLSFYPLSKEGVIPLTFVFDPERFSAYYETVVWPAIRGRPSFWLLLRAAGPAPYIARVDAWLTEKGGGAITKAFQKDFGGVSVVRYTGR